MVTIWLAPSAPLYVIKTLMRLACGTPYAIDVIFAVLVRWSAR